MDKISLTPSDDKVYTINSDGSNDWCIHDNVTYGLSDSCNLPSGSVILAKSENDNTKLVSHAVDIENKLIRIKVLVHKFENNLLDTNLYVKIEKILYKLMNINDQYMLDDYKIKDDSEVIHQANMLKVYWKIVKGEMRMNDDWDKINTLILELIDLVNE